MCGFVCVFSPNSVFEHYKVEQALNKIQHRGPDESSLWSNAEHTVHLGHARLSIIDLKGGSQPLSNASNSIHCVVNGEFYDYKRIRQELIREGYTFKTASDSEILIALYERYGVGCLEYIRGEFSFVLWDERTRKIFAGRDRFGIKPLFYYQDKGAVYFASEVKALAELGLSMAWDKESLWQEVSFFHLPDRSLFKDVHEVPPAHYVIKSFSSTTLSTYPYWDMNYLTTSQQSQNVWDEEEVIEGFREKFEEAIKFRLTADVPVASYLSGGIDSCSVLGTAQKLSSQPITAFTLSFDHTLYDEASYAKEMADHCQSHYHQIPITGDLIADAFEDTLYKGEKLIFNCNAVSKYLLSQRVQEQGFKVVLTGEGADEILAGYAGFRQDFIQHHMHQMSDAERQSISQGLEQANEVSQGVLMSTQSFDSLDVVNRYLGFVPNWMVGFTHMGKMVRQVFTQEFLQYTENREPASQLVEALAVPLAMKGRGRLHQSLYSWTKSMLPHYLLTMLGDRMEMAHSIEGRLPFLDHKLVEYVVGLPERFKIRGMKEKYLLREAMKPVLTQRMYKRQKHPFLTPPAKAPTNKKLNTLMLDILHSQHVRELPFIDQKKALAFFNGVGKMDKSQQNLADSVLHLVVSMGVMQKKFNLNT